jgi:tRNA A37 threonylcarbamoyladenosine modification protein TsaB
MNKQQTTNNKQPILLAIDTATPALVIGIGEPDKMLASHFTLVHRNHLELSIPTIDNLVKKAGIKLEDLSAIAVGLGPGSLIGARVGVVIAKTLAQVLKVALIGISTLDAKQNLYPTPEALMKLAFDKLKKGQVSSLYDLEPIYLRGPV